MILEVVNNAFGLGWQLGAVSISRKTQKGIPLYQDDFESDTFLFSGAEDLVPFLIEESGEWKKVIREEDGYKVFSYRPRTEGLFVRIERWANTKPGISYWQVISKDNSVSIYGKSKASRISHPDDERKIFQWFLERTYDDKGNCMVFEYKKENIENVPNSLSESNRIKNGKAFTNTYLKKIKYGNSVPVDRLTGIVEPETKWLFQVVLDYGEHGEDIPVHNEIDQWTCRKDPFSSYRSGFEIRTYRLCKRILMFHHFKELGIDPCLVASTDMAHDQNPLASKVVSISHRSYDGADTASLPPIEFKYTEAFIDPEIKAFDPKELNELLGGIDGVQMKFMDLLGEGLSGLSPAFQPFKTVAERPSLSSNKTQLTDIDGDGSLELLVQENGLNGFFEKDLNGEWESFKSFKDNPNINWNDSNLRMIDVTGDGHADILITEDNCFTWYASKVKEGYEPPNSVVKALNEEVGADLVFSDSTQSIYLADMSGDGLNDILRIRNGGICYWPNLGYGKFGAKVSMDNAPLFDYPNQFDQKRIKIGDVDGSGSTDILYIGSDTIRYWSNQSGNGFSEVNEIAHHLPTDNLSTISIIDLMADGKPYLLSEINNNMGVITRNYYAPSTKFYLEAEQNEKPWITKLPFPVHVLEKTALIDEIEQNVFTSRYAYHHGYYDRQEREFRGFGLVEQWDTEEYDISPKGNNVNADSFVPPVYTKTWIHTGFYKDKGTILRQYAHEYYQGDTDSWKLTDIKLPETLTVDEIYEAHRVLKGSTLRQEVYAFRIA